VQEFGSDAVVETDAVGHVLHVAANGLAKIGDLVDEGDLHGEKRIGGILDQLGRPPRREDQGRLVEIERAVDFGHDGARAFVIDADDDAVRALEVLDGRAFSQELRVRHDTEVGGRIGLANDAFHLVAGAHGHAVDLVMTTVKRLRLVAMFRATS
jgi:hypothetical protein